MSGAPPDTSAESAPPERFDELLARLRALVERLESGQVTLEEGLRCFEEGMTLCRKGVDILDRAERRVEVLLSAGAGGPRTAPFADAPGGRADRPDRVERLERDESE